jgi:hypothetical protein
MNFSSVIFTLFKHVIKKKYTKILDEKEVQTK